jgi:hypothetical protein
MESSQSSVPGSLPLRDRKPGEWVVLPSSILFVLPYEGSVACRVIGPREFDIIKSYNPSGPVLGREIRIEVKCPNGSVDSFPLATSSRAATEDEIKHTEVIWKLFPYDARIGEQYSMQMLFSGTNYPSSRSDVLTESSLWETYWKLKNMG